MDLTQLSHLNCTSTYSVSSISYSLGTLTLVVDFSEDLEERTCNLSLSFDPSIIDSANSTISFTVNSINEPLIFYSNVETLTAIKNIFKVLSLIALVLSVLTIHHKLIGAELMICCQMVYLSLCFYSKPSYLMKSIEAFHLVSNWSLFSS